MAHQLTDREKQKITTALRNANIWGVDESNLLFEFEKLIVTKLRQYDVDIQAPQLRANYPNDIEAAIKLIEGSSSYQQESAAGQFAAQSGVSQNLYRKQLRKLLQDAQIYNYPESPQNPELQFEELLVQQIRKYDVDINQSTLKITYPDDIENAKILLDQTSSSYRKENSAGHFAAQSNVIQRTYRKQLREILTKAQIYNYPESPSNPEPNFEELLVSRIRKFDVDINPSTLKIKYPDDIEAAKILIEATAGPYKQETQAGHFATQSNLPQKAYRKRIREILTKAQIYNYPESPSNPESNFEELLVSRIRKFDVDINPSTLKIKYPDDLDRAKTLIEATEGAYKQETEAGYFASQSNIPQKAYRKRIREILTKAQIYSHPESPGNPEPHLVTLITERLKNLGVQIPANKDLSINYPDDLDAVKTLALQTESKAQQMRAAKEIADKNNLKLASDINPNAATSSELPNKPNNILPIIPRSDALPPVKLDRTLTLPKLLQSKETGKTNLETLAEQGQLSDVFTSDIWLGRREELDQAWEAVPEKYRNQVNIEVVRGKLSQATFMDRFKVDKQSGWDQGF